MDVVMHIGTEYEKMFLEEVIKHIIVNFASNLDLSGIVSIELLPHKTIPNESSGRMENKKLLLSYHLLSDIAYKCENYNSNTEIDFKKVSGDYKVIEEVNVLFTTIYHELFHFDDRKKRPKLYASVEINWDENIYLSLAALYWIEFSTHYNGKLRETEQHMQKYCNNFVNRNWNFSNEEYFYMLKQMPYFIYRCFHFSIIQFNELITKIDNIIEQKMVIECREVSEKLITLEKFDDYVELRQLEIIFRKAYKKTI